MGPYKTRMDEKDSKEAHRGWIRYVMFHYTLLLHVIDHATLIGTYNEISELPVGKREWSGMTFVCERETNTCDMETGWWTT